MTTILALLAKLPWWLYVALALFAIIGFQALEVHHYKSSEATYKASDAIYQSAQKTNLATIATLKAANLLWSSSADKQQELAATSIGQDASYASIQAQNEAKANQNLKVIYERVPAARTWSTVPVDLSVAAQLRANAGSAD